MASDPLASFTPEVRDWFTRSFERPTEAQAQAWPAIAAGDNVLLSAPTGSGKTLAAFLWALDRLARQPLPEGERKTRLVYVSPLKALSYDVEKNLRAPLKGIGGDTSVAIRTGDTPQKERQAMLRKPPDVLITTPESLYLMLTSKAREFLVDAEAVIVDEIHAVARTKRGWRRWPAGRFSGSGCPPRSGRSRRLAASSWAAAASARSSTPACASHST
jgi:ATP-dependent Lhr-like helicase